MVRRPLKRQDLDLLAGFTLRSRERAVVPQMPIQDHPMPARRILCHLIPVHGASLGLRSAQDHRVAVIFPAPNAVNDHRKLGICR